MRETPEPLTYREHLPAVYRFAFLMTGSVPTAAEVLRRTVEEAERGDLSDVRDSRRVKRWLFARARSLCGKPLALPEALDAPPTLTPEGEAPLPDFADDSTRQLAAMFASLPEAERSAAVLFYLYLFDPNHLAETLGVKPDELAALLSRARKLLQNQHAACESVFSEPMKEAS